jgi:hypothetical protein
VCVHQNNLICVRVCLYYIKVNRLEYLIYSHYGKAICAISYFRPIKAVAIRILDRHGYKLTIAIN